ncbi:MAG: M48 family metallopeptidase [Patescibacteria group bacterium]
MNIYSAISSNKWKTWTIMVLFVVFITTLVYVFAKSFGLSLSLVGFSFIIAGLMSLGSYYYSDKLVLATAGAKQVAKKDYPEYYRIVENLALGSGVLTPKIYVINDSSPNAFATGRSPKHAVVCVTTGLLSSLSEVELEGVIAHELSHIKNLDIRLMAIVAILVGFVAILADIFMRSLWFSGNNRDNKGSQIFLIIGIIFAILSPIIATLIQLAVSRKREFLAVASGAILTRYPE